MIDFKSKKVIDGKEFVSLEEINNDYDLRKTSRLFRKNSEGVLEKIPGASWKRMFRVNGWALLAVAVVIMTFFMVKDYKDVYNNPCDYCTITGCKPLIEFPTNETLKEPKDIQKVYTKQDIYPYDNLQQ